MFSFNCLYRSINGYDERVLEECVHWIIIGICVKSSNDEERLLNNLYMH